MRKHVLRVHALMRKRLTPLLAFALLALGHAPAADAARLDPSFGAGGFVEAPGSPEWVNLSSAFGHRVADYPGRRLVVGGHSKLGFTVWRYRSDGRLDRSFGDGGIAIVTLPNGDGAEGSFGSVSAIAVQPDGKILVGGIYTPYPVDNCEECEPEYGDPREYTALVRLDPNGGLDTHFGGSRRGRHLGEVLMHSKTVNEIAVRGGKIFIAGEEVLEPGEVGYVARLDLDGSRDKGFGRRGLQQVPPSGKRPPGAGVAGLRFDPAGHVYLGGYDRGRFMLARLTSRGRIDRSFADGGVVRTRVGGRCRCSWGEGLARDRRGRLLVSGYARTGGGHAIAVARYLPDGRLDRSFGRHGIVRTRVGKAAFGYGVTVQRDGRIVVAGSTSRRSPFFDLFTVVRYLPDGRRDRSFFGDGIFKARFVKGGDRAIQPLVDGSGRLVVAGETVVARFLPVPRRRGGR